MYGLKTRDVPEVRVYGDTKVYIKKDQDKGQGPYKGFLLAECEECKDVRGFCAKQGVYSYRCKVCGEETPLENLRMMYVSCKCGAHYTYKTNLTEERFTYTCLACGAPVRVQLNNKKTTYVTR